MSACIVTRYDDEVIEEYKKNWGKKGQGGFILAGALRW
jgi:hypothetical protein